MKKIAIYGGAFDPMHQGHLFVINETLSKIKNLDELWVMPCYNHNQKNSVSSFESRLNILNFLTKNLNKVKVSLYEKNNNIEGGTLVFLNKIKEPRHI